MTIEPIHIEVATPLPVARAFERFVGELREWWPREYTWSQDVLQELGIEPRVDGLCFEIGPHGFRCDWGRVVEWAPPHRLGLAWQIGPHREPVPDPRQASCVSVSFETQSPQHTRVVLVHTAFERHGPDGAAYRAAMTSPRGWPFILQRFVESTT
jgi:uncharacterized protein YndB with AHSA1/START domain